MAGMLKKSMSWLGLGPDDDYGDYDDYAYEEPVVDLTSQPAVHPSPTVRAVAPKGGDFDDWDDSDASASVRVVSASSGVPRARAFPGQPSPEPIRQRSAVRQVSTPTSTKPHLVAPESFNDAQEVGDWFKKQQPVILNLQGLDRDLVRRMLDFASGVAYALGGTVERVATQVYLLTPTDVEVSQDDRRRVLDRALSGD